MAAEPARIAAASLRACVPATLPGAVRPAIEEAFGDPRLVDAEAGPRASLVKVTRRAMERAPPEMEPRELDYILCEVLASIWDDPGWREAWGSSGSAGWTSEFAKHCPLRQILMDASYALSYGNAESNRKYFKNFGRLAMQATMLQDETRTGSYNRAILRNRVDFEGKVVMDVGSGTGMLAFFAVQAGAARVYCIEASPMAEVIKQLAQANGWADKIVVVNKVLQDIRDDVPERVDCITHETLGNFLFAERGIETVLVARDRFLKPGGKLFPARATFCVAPFEDGKTYRARVVKAMNLWTCKDFYGVDLSSQGERSRREMFRRPLSDQFHPDMLRADAHTQVFDFYELRTEEVRNFDVSFRFRSKATCVMHGIAGWFDAEFEGSACSVVLSTSPWDTLTHWWMTRLTLLEPLAVNAGEEVTGLVGFAACDGNTYMCRLVMESGGVRREIDGMDLADSDSAHRAPQHKTHQITPHAKVQIIDWEGTKATPTAVEVLIDDPLREAKLAAARSEAASGREAPAGRKAATGKEAAAKAGAGQAPGDRAAEGRDYGSQIRVNDALFMLVDDPGLCASLTGPSSALVLVGSLGGALLMAPPQMPIMCIVELAVGGLGVQPRCWLAFDQAKEHMQAFILKHQAPGSPEEMGEEEIGALDLQRLIANYVKMKRAIAPARAPKSCPP